MDNEYGPIFIGGCGSTGSTLLARILNSHSEIVCGPELNAFCKNSLYELPYNKFVEELPGYLQQGIPNSGWNDSIIYFTRFEQYGWTKDDIIGTAGSSDAYSAFMQHLFQGYCRRNHKPMWVEKTPANCYCFKEILMHFPNAKVIHTIRDGRDVVCSLAKRGFSAMWSINRWLYDTFAGLLSRDNERYLEVKYEDLVLNTAATVKKICRHVGVAFEESMLSSPDIQNSRKSKLESWEHDPFSAPNPSSIGRYKNDLNDYQTWLINRIRLKEHALNPSLHNKHLSFTELLRMLGYQNDQEMQSTKSYLIPALKEHLHWQLIWKYRSLKWGWGLREFPFKDKS